MRKWWKRTASSCECLARRPSGNVKILHLPIVSFCFRFVQLREQVAILRLIKPRYVLPPPRKFPTILFVHLIYIDEREFILLMRRKKIIYRRLVRIYKSVGKSSSECTRGKPIDVGIPRWPPEAHLLDSAFGLLTVQQICLTAIFCNYLHFPKSTTQLSW